MSNMDDINDDTREIIITQKEITVKQKEVKKRKHIHRWQHIATTLFSLDDPLVREQIAIKINGYKQQDKKKKKYDPSTFIQIDDIITQMKQCDMKCWYCQQQMSIFYDNVRDSTQWSVDRIDNRFGHNRDNFYLACLHCNLTRRCRNDKQFLYGKQLIHISYQDKEES